MNASTLSRNSVRGAARLLVWSAAASAPLLFPSPATADVGPPVEIKMAADTKPAASGQEYDGAWEVHVHRPGTLSDFRLEGEGWTVLQAELPAGAERFAAGTVRIPFRVRPANADNPIALSLLFNGRLVRQQYSIGPAYFAQAGKPKPLAQVSGTGGLMNPSGPVSPTGEPGDSATSARGGSLRIRGRIVYSRPGRDLSDPGDGDFDDPEDIPPLTVGADRIDVRLYDEDPVGRDEMWSGWTDEHGYFDVSGISTDVDGDGSGPDLVLYADTSTADWVDVTDNSVGEYTYSFETEEMTDFEGNFHEFGWQAPADTGLHPALHIFNSITRARRYILEKPGYVTPAVQVEWPDDSRGDGAWYEDDSNEIHVSTGREWRDDTHTHEYGHHFIDSLYDPDPPGPDYCNGMCDGPDCDGTNCGTEACANTGHCMWCAETDHDAFSEGWPNWLADVVTRDYPLRYTLDVNGPAYKPLFTRDQETPGQCNGMFFDDPVTTEGFIGVLLRDIEDPGQDDHDDDPHPDVVSRDGVFDLLCTGFGPMFSVLDNHQPITILDFINGFLVDFPEHTGSFWPTAFNVGGSAYVAGFPADAQPPGVVPACDSPSHPFGAGGPLPCITFEWDPAPDDATGASTYSYVLTTNASGEEPDEMADTVFGTGNCKLGGRAIAGEIGQYYLSIKAQDNDGNWSSQWATFGPFEVTDCNGTGLLDVCDTSCSAQNTGDPACNLSALFCNITGCGASADCNVNFQPDECDLAQGLSEDCDEDGVPDECHATVHWAAASGSWHDPAKWDTAAVPQSGDHVCIDVPGSQTVEHSTGPTTIDTLACRESLTVSGGTLTIGANSFVDDTLKVIDAGGVALNASAVEVGRLEMFRTGIGASGALSGIGATHVLGSMMLDDYPQLNGFHQLVNFGAAASTGRLYLYDNAQFINEQGATYVQQDDGSPISHDYAFVGEGNNSQFINYGTFIKSEVEGYGGRVTISAKTMNYGEIRAESGILWMYAGLLGQGSQSIGGLWRGEPGATISFYGGPHQFDSASTIEGDHVIFEGSAIGPIEFYGTYDVSASTTISVSQSPLTFSAGANLVSFGDALTITSGIINVNAPGAIAVDTVNMTNGIVTFNNGAPVNLGTLNLSQGTLQGPSTITVSGVTTWPPAGHFIGPGVVNANGGLFVPPGGSVRRLYQRTFNNAGPATFLGQIECGHSAVFNNLPSGIVDLQSDGTAFFMNAPPEARPVVNNAGTLLKSVGTGTSWSYVNFNNSGTVEVQVGELEFLGATYVQTAGATLLSGGNLTSTQFFNGPNNTLAFQGGRLAGAGLVTAHVSNTGATVEPGASAGTLTISGNYTQAAGGSLEVELGGPSPGTEYDRLSVSGSATLGGTLEIVEIGGFMPQGGDAFDVVTAASVSGTFAQVIAPRQYAVTYGPTYVRLEIPDCNTNGAADELDLASGTSDDCNTNAVPDECDLAVVSEPISQWASYVIGFSTQYSSGSWSAAQALGAPNTMSYGDIATAWAPSQQNGTLEYVTVGYPAPVYATGATIRETWGNGMVYQVDVLDIANVLYTVWSGTDPSPPGAPVDFAVNWPMTPYRVKGLKIYTNTNHNLGTYEEIDAIAIHGVTALPPDCDGNGALDACESGDCNGNGVLDACDPVLEAYAPFLGCLGGPSVPYGSPECGCLDTDADQDIDLADFASFQS